MYIAIDIFRQKFVITPLLSPATENTSVSEISFLDISWIFRLSNLPGLDFN